MLEDNADSFFENFEENIVIKSNKNSPRVKDHPRAYIEQPANYTSKNQICKSLERIFSMCNANQTIKKQVSSQENTHRMRTQEATNQPKYIESNKNHSLNQLKCLFQKRLENAPKTSQTYLNGASSSRPQNISFHQIGEDHMATMYLPKKTLQSQQSYLLLKQHMNKKPQSQKSKSFLSFQREINESNANNTSEIQPQARVPAESIHHKQSKSIQQMEQLRPKNVSLHSQGTIHPYKQNPYSLVQLLKPRNDVNKSRQNSTYRNSSPSSISPFITTRGQKKQPYCQVNNQTFNYNTYYINKIKRNDSFNQQENSRAAENYAVYMNFEEFKRKHRAYSKGV